MPYAFYERTADGTVRDITDELPFDVPDSWEWVRLEEVAEAIDPQPSHRTPPVVANGVAYIGMAECNNATKRIDFQKARRVSNSVLYEHLNRYTLHDGDFIIGKIGTIGNPFLIPSQQDYVLSANVVLIQPNQDKVNPTFMFYQFGSSIVGNHIINNSVATSQSAFGIQKARKLLMALPPLAEQRRIVERIEQLLPHIADYDTAEQKLTALNTSFPDQLKKSILQAAVQGKLVPQDPNDEPASALLERIRAERERLIREGKIKRGKQESVIFRRDNSHYRYSRRPLSERGKLPIRFCLSLSCPL